VGMTNNPPARYTQHLADKADSPKVAWINELRTHGVKPVMGIIEECTEANVRSREIFWIEYYLSKGIELTNSALGFEQKTVQSVARYYMSHLRPKRGMAIHPTMNGNGSNRNMRQSPKTRIVIEYFKANPHRLNETCTALESEIGVGKSTINSVQNAIRSGEIEL